MHDRISSNALCFPGASLARLASIWAQLGPARISFAGALGKAEIPVAYDIIEAGGYRLETTAYGFALGRRLVPSDSPLDQREALSTAIDTVARLGGRSIYMTSGGHGDGTWEEAARCFSTAIAPCVAQAQRAGVELMIETTTMLHADIHLAHSLRDTMTLAEMAGIGVCIDLFACWSEAGLKETIECAVPRCGLVQVSDYTFGDRSLPSRTVPGDGDVPLQRILDWLLSAGYTGAFDLELIGPRIDAAGHMDATRRAGDRIGEMLHSLGA